MTTSKPAIFRPARYGIHIAVANVSAVGVCRARRIKYEQSYPWRNFLRALCGKPPIRTHYVKDGPLGPIFRPASLMVWLGNGDEPLVFEMRSTDEAFRERDRLIRMMKEVHGKEEINIDA